MLLADSPQLLVSQLHRCFFVEIEAFLDSFDRPESQIPDEGSLDNRGHIGARTLGLSLSSGNNLVRKLDCHFARHISIVPAACSFGVKGAGYLPTQAFKRRSILLGRPTQHLLHQLP
jgi:hypothetical protein